MSEPGGPTRDESPADGAHWETVARVAASRFEHEGVEEPSAFVRELLVLGLADGAYAISVERVREIVRMRRLTPVPRSPDWLLGVVALRGEIVEVVDLRVVLGLTAAEPDRSSRIIVLHGDVERVTGVLVDSVSEVVRLPESEASPGSGLESNAVEDVFRRGDRFVSILDVDRVLELCDG